MPKLPSTKDKQYLVFRDMTGKFFAVVSTISGTQNIRLRAKTFRAACSEVSILLNINPVLIQ